MLLFTIKTYSQEYINTQALIAKIEKQVNSPSFDLESLNTIYDSFHIDKNNRKVNINIQAASKKELNATEIFSLRMPTVFMFLQVYEPSNSKVKKINSAGTTYPISEDGHFLVNNHMLDELGLGNGDINNVEKSVHLMIADYAGNIYSIDSVVTFSREADFAIIKANTNGKKIKPNPIGTDLRAGSDVYVISHPTNYFYYYSTGRVARMTENNNGIMSRKMEITADYAAGSSGGPIFDNKGNLVGMVSLTRSIYYNPEEQKNLQMVVKESIPISPIMNLIKSN